MDPVPLEALAAGSSASSRKPAIALAVVGLLAVAAAGAVFVTLRKPAQPIAATQSPVVAVAAAPQELEAVREEAVGDAGDSDGQAIDEPQEWEGKLVQARQALASGEIDQAYAIANDLPADSVLRETPEFGEIRYRYVQAHIDTAADALEKGEVGKARSEARFVLELAGITSKQRSDAKRLMRNARPSSSTAKPAAASAAPKADPKLALEAAYACVARGDNACVVRALSGGKARSPAAMALLIETYRATDDLGAARKQMTVFVRRYPDNPRTAKYRQLLAAE